jgi:hypothetical protein
MSTEHDEQPTELTYPTTIRLVLASDDSDKENHIPDIRRDEIAVKLEQPTTESLGGNSIEGTGGSAVIDCSDPLRQDLPRSVTPDTGTNRAETTRIMASIPDVLRNEIDRQPLRPIPLRQTQTCNQSFSNLRSSQEIHDRINYIAAFAGLTIAHDDQHRLARLWSLLKDDRFAVAVTQRARGLFNWQCTDLIEIFINIAKLEWNKPLCPGTSIEQFGLDLLRRILAADVERLYDAAIDDVCANQYRVIPKNENPMDLIYMKYTHPLTIIAPDIHFAATTSIPPGTRPAVEQEREAILEFLREERRQIRLLKSLLDMVDSNDHELILRYEDSPVTRDEDWGAFAWGPLPQWEDPPPPPPPQE